MTNKNLIAEKAELFDCQIETTALPCILKPGKFEIWDGGSFWGITCYKHTMAIRLNRVLRTYQPDTPFKANDEVVFKVSKKFGALKAVKNALHIKGA